MASSLGDVRIDLGGLTVSERLARHREVYDRACAEAGIAATYDGYWRWRTVVMRTTGRNDFEAVCEQMAQAFHRVADAAILLGVSLADAEAALKGRRLTSASDV